jgi:hypothetical protein
MPLLSENAVSSPTPTNAPPREEMIRLAAYFRSQHRQSWPRNELEDWLVAEEQIDRGLTGYA